MHGIRYFIYARKSTETEDKQVTSIEDQISETKKIAKELNLEIVDIISESKSAKEPGRQAFNEMLSRIHKGEADGILCWKLNRLARNPVDGGQISWMLQQNIIKHIQTFGRDYKPQDNVLMMQVEFGMANQFINDLRTDIKRGLQKKAERGWMPLQRLPIGYIHNPNKKNTSKEIIRDKKYFLKVKRLWELILTGDYTISDLKREGDAMGIKNPQNSYLSLSSYYRLFANPFYAGKFRWKDSEGNKVEYLGKHEIMIGFDEFEHIQKVFSARYVAPKFESDNSYISLFICGECGCSITREQVKRAYCKKCKRKFSIKNKTSCSKCNTSITKTSQFTFLDKVYYRCTKKKKVKCSQKYISELELTKSIETYFERMTFSDDFLQWSIEAFEYIKKQSPNEDLEKELIKSKNKLNRRLENYTIMRADNEISAGEFAKLKIDINDHIKKITKQLESLSRGNEEAITPYKKALHFLELTKKSFKKRGYKERRFLIRQLGSNPKIFDKKLYFSTPKSFYTLKDCYNLYKAEKGRLEPKNNLENLSVFDQVNLPFSFLWREVQQARTINNNNIPCCDIDNMEYQLN